MKKLTIAAISLATCATVGLLAACDSCNKDKKGSDADISLKKYWAGNENEETYSFKNEANGDLTVKYEKSGQWQYASRSFAYEAEADLALMKTLVLEGSMVTSTNDPMVTLKITYKGTIPEKEVHFTMSESKATYEWDLSNAQLDQALSLMLFAEGNRVSATGTITINDIHLTAKAINQANNIEKSEPADEKVVNEITATNKTLNGGWYDSGDSVYTVEKSGTDYNVTYSKKSFEYPNVQAIVKGDAIKTFKTLRVTVKGTAGEKFRINFYDGVTLANHESEIVTLTGGDDEIILDLTTFIADFDCSVEQKVFIMAQPGTTDVSGSFTIKNAEFSMEEAPAPEVQVVNEITATNKTVNGGWYDNGDAVYTFTKDGTSYNVAYDKGGREYPMFKAIVKGGAIADMKTLLVTIKGTEGERIAFKPFDQCEQTFTLTGGDDVLVIDLTEVTNVDFTTEKNILAHVQPGATNVTGTFIIKNAEFSTEEAPAPVEEKVVNEITAASATLNGGWYDDGAGAYTVAKGDNVYNVTYNKASGHQWVNVNARVKGDAIKTYKTLRVTVKGTAGEVFKINLFTGSNHESAPFTLTGGNDEIVLDITSFIADVDCTTPHLVIIMAQPGTDNVSGAFTIVNATFSTEEISTPVEEKVVNTITADSETLNGGWYDNGDLAYTAEKAADGSFNVTYNKKSNGFASIYAGVTGDAIKTFKTLRVTIKGTEGEKFRINFWTGANHESDTLTLTGGDDVIILDLTKFDNLADVDYTATHRVIIMAQYNVQNVSGTFAIKNAEFSMEEAPAPVNPKVINQITATDATVNGGWYDDGAGAYTVVKSDDVYNVTYNKVAGQEWVNVNATVTGEAIKDYKTLRVTVKGTAGEKFKINLYTNGNHESDEFTLTGGNDEIVLDITPFISTVDCTKQHLVIIMAQPGSVNVNGTFSIINATFSAEEAPSAD